MKAYIESFDGIRYIAEIEHDDTYQPAGGLGDINPALAMRIISKTEITLRWSDEPIATIRCREIAGIAGEYRCIEITDAEEAAILAAMGIKADDEIKAEIAEIETAIRGVYPETLPTAAEAAEKARRWNDTQNEGVEGYVPHYMTREEYNRLKARRNALAERI